MNRLNGKIALITGGASGLGQGIAERFVEEGAQVVLTDVNDEAGARTAEVLGCTFVAQDVADEAGWERVMAEVDSRHQHLDVLVNNAGVFSSCPVDEMPLAEWQRVLGINLTGVFLGCKHGVAAMKRNPDATGGSIINLSSVVGLRGQVGGAAYSASKGGVRLLTKTVAMESARLGIRCNSIHPGVIDTPIMDPIFAGSRDPEALRERIEGQLPIGYMGDPAKDIGNMAVYLAADESRYVTGTEMIVDGGMTAGLPTG
jgi:NAD(P)-dependent dehydrogenase (short-subunit alcohol dehydrogenase family)